MSPSDWPPDIEYSPSDADTPLASRAPRAAATSESLATYKLDKAPDLTPTTSLALVNHETKATPTVRGGPGQLYHGPTSFKSDTMSQEGFLNKGRLLDLKQLVIKERVSPSAVRSARAANRRKQENSGALSRGRGTERKPVRKSDRSKTSRAANGGPESLYDRFRASKSGKKQRKMYGVSICDVYESKPEPDVFSYGLFLSTPMSSPPASKQKLDPLMNVKPVTYVNNLKSHWAIPAVNSIVL